MHGCHIVSFFVRTYHNEVADWLTREEVKKVHDTLATSGWKRLEPPAARGQILEDAKERLLRLPGETGPVAEAALRHRALQRGHGLPRTLPLQGKLGREVGSRLNPYTKAFKRLGGSEPKENQKTGWLMAS
eukprot:8552157-Pyramimonas_sp.AAC.1